MVHEDAILEFARGLGGEQTEEMLSQNEGQSSKSLRVLKKEGKIFLVVWEGSNPLRIEVKCDGKLGKLLREKYESVLLSKTLGGSGIEIICSGQLTDDEILDLVRFSWNYTAKFD